MALRTDVDEWIDGNLSALVLKEYLIPVEGKESPFFPPTFAGSGEDGSSYCIDVMKDGTRTCLVDTVGSQANRMEPVFTKSPYSDLIPQITIRANDKEINLCDIGHRAADAFLRNSSLHGPIEKALTDLSKNDALALGNLAPTSLVFGLWDSRGTRVKMPRVISSVIRAYDVDELHRSAQYFPPIDYRDEKLLGEYAGKKDKDARSSLGFNENPSTDTHGGIIAHGDIRRDVVINFAALRKINSAEKKDSLQRYILGLAMIAASSAQECVYLRQGCSLTLDPDKGTPAWQLVYPDGTRKDIKLNRDEILEYAKDVARQFGVGENINGDFELQTAKNEIEEELKGKK